jgi:hypothetical protein
VGAGLVLLAFILMKAKIISAHGHVFDLLTLGGCIVLLVSAIIDNRWGFILLNVVWALISFVAIVRRIQRERRDEKV